MERKAIVRRSLSVLMLAMAASDAACRGAARDALSDTVIAVDRSIDALTDPSADFRTILQRLLQSLPSYANPVVRAAIRTFLHRAPGANADLECGPDFLRLRARQELISIEERLVEGTSEPREPQFCYTAPFAIDLTRVPNTLEIYGYDFDLVPLEMVLVSTDGYRDVSAALIPRTHYHLTLVLGERGVRLSPNSELLGLTWGHLIHHTTAIVQHGTPLCSCTIEEIPPGRTVEYAPTLVRGGSTPPAEAGSPSVWANAVVDYESNELSATICMSVLEQVRDRGIRSGCVRAFILTVAPEQSIEWLFGRPGGRATYPRRGGQDADSEGPAEGELLRTWRFAGFGSDSATPRITLEMGKIRLVSTGEGRCVSPIAYLEARRTGAMSAATVRALDRQLLHLDPAVSALRPRFAPDVR